jgi:quercetin dioxygenase-like cupin family protein
VVLMKNVLAVIIAVGALSAVPALAQRRSAPPAPPAPTPSAQTPPVQGAPPGSATPAAPGQTPGRGGGQGVGSQGDPDPGVHFLVVVDNPNVRVLQVTLQPGAVRRPHVHNDVTFHMLVPVTGGLELTVDGQPFSAVPGQAYYMVKGQPHGFTNKTAAPVQVIELFIKPPAVGAAP